MIFYVPGDWLELVYEPCHEKICLWVFRPGPTQTGLYSHRRWLEAWNFEIRKQRDYTINVAKTKALISCAVHRTADLRLCFRICKKSRFSHDAAHLIFYVPGDWLEFMNM